MLNNNFQDLPISAKSKAKITRVLNRFGNLDERIHKADIPEPERTLEELKRMFKVVYDEVDFPCRELCQIYSTIAVFYQMTSKLSKLRKLHTTPTYNE